ncbi:hypothetical protein Lgra_0960 [Legionella gratiana]|uniref:Uncharacterized protein n=1 Tax=Legionella gratiana TaxID=45066 RepID=A0A378J0F2_9GAMM|nr:lysylphosphatidylglycerol synthase transmembrane domain-containing protein [Legionella gratiana]KTD12952.1 hypothetical protein Lgra_0960 [Legionella gratiana]STX41224.1 Uncharacterised protein family (UPF0104) [Legionella gratiana]
MLLRNSISKKLIFLGKLGVLGILVFVLFKYQLIDINLLQMLRNHIDIISIACLCLFLGILLGAVRWKILIDAVDLEIQWKDVLQLYLIGSFFSSYLPGAAGGDAVRVFYLYRSLNSKRSIAFMTLLVDRLFSLLGLVYAAGVIYLLYPMTLAKESTLYMYGKITFLLIFCSIFFMILGFTLLSFIHKKQLYNAFPTRIKVFFHSLIPALLLYQKKWLTLLYSVVLSILASSIVALGIMEFASLFSFNPGALISLIAGIYANLSSAIPVTPGGIGVGEVTFAKVCTDLSGTVAPFATIYFIFRLAMMFVNIPGCITYLLYNNHSSQKNHDALVSERGANL